MPLSHCLNEVWAIKYDSVFYLLGLTLVSAPHLARSYHHLFPLDAFQEIPLEEHNGERYMSFD